MKNCRANAEQAVGQTLMSANTTRPAAMLEKKRSPQGRQPPHMGQSRQGHCNKSHRQVVQECRARGSPVRVTEDLVWTFPSPQSNKSQANSSESSKHGDGKEASFLEAKDKKNNTAPSPKALEM